MILKLISIEPISEDIKKKIKAIYEESNNPNDSMLNSIPEYQFSQGNVLYFCGLRTVHPNIEEIEI